MCRPDQEINPARIWTKGCSVYHGNYGFGVVDTVCDPKGWVLVSFKGAEPIKCAHALLTPGHSA